MAALGWLLFGTSVLLLAYAFGVYPLLAAWMARRAPARKEAASERCPPVTLIVAARNEEAHLAARLENACALDYPDLHIVVASDGSTDATEQIAREWPDPRVELVATPVAAGKTAAVARALEATGREGIFAFTDATAVWPEQTLRQLVAPFADETVGAVSGLVLYDYHPEAISSGFATYQALVVPSRMADSTIGWVTSVSGSICAIRSELWERVPPELSTDLVYPLLAAAKGKRAILEPRALSGEDSRRRPAREFRSRFRLALSAYTFMGYLLGRAKELPARYLWQVLSHKVLRWLAPWLAVQAVLGALLLYPTQPNLTVSVLTAAAALVTLGLLGLVPVLGRLFAAPLWALTVAAAYLAGLAGYLTGMRVAGWDPQSQR